MSELPVEIGWLVLRQFEELGIEYMLVGSVASSLQGVARSTLDLDVLANIAPAQARELVSRLGDEFYISEAAVSEALRRSSMFNVIQFSSGFKVDIYILGNRPFELEEFRRRIPFHDGDRKLWVATPEDLILSKLDWFRAGGEVSERQWRDVLGLLQIHRPQLDSDYLERWSKTLKVDHLWQRALKFCPADEQGPADQI